MLQLDGAVPETGYLELLGTPGRQGLDVDPLARGGQDDSYAVVRDHPSADLAVLEIEGPRQRGGPDGTAFGAAGLRARGLRRRRPGDCPHREGGERQCSAEQGQPSQRSPLEPAR